MSDHNKPVTLTRPCIALALVSMLSTVASAQSTRYTIRRLPGIEQLTHGRAHGIDNANNVVGELIDTSSGLEQPIVWNHGVARRLPAHPGGQQGRVRAISDNGLIGGDAGTTATPNIATLWRPTPQGYVATDLGKARGDFFSQVLGINAVGNSCGYTDDGFVFRPCIWITQDEFEAPYLLPLPDGFIGGDAFAIDANDFVVGSFVTTLATYPATWSRDGATWRPSRLPSLLPAVQGCAKDLNTAGTIAGSAVSPVTGRNHVVTWTKGTITDLGTLDNGDCFSAAINDNGDIVGTVRTFASPPQVAFLLQEEGTITDLNTLLPPRSPWTLARANDINDHGAIVGTGVLDGFLEPFIMIPTSVTMTPPAPGVADSISALDVAGATPGQPLFFFVALTGGETPIPGCLEGLDLSEPLLLGSSLANGRGEACLSLHLPGALAGTPLLFQAYDPSACHTSGALEFSL